MPGNSIGQLFRVSTWGESHGKALGVLIDGCPPGISLDEKDIQIELDRRKPKGVSGTSRREEDSCEILSGVFEGKTTGTPISIVTWNKNARSRDYKELKELYRPGHADYTYEQKYGIRDYRGGGRSSGRETVARVMAGAVANKIIAKNRISVIGHTIQIGDIVARRFNIKEIANNELKCADKIVAQEMLSLLTKVKKEKDSVGGTIELVIKGTPAGLGDPVFDKLDADLAKAMMSIGGVKAVSVGAGFETALMRGSENNDEFEVKKSRVRTRSNNAGGVLGGISSGEDIVLHIAIKAPASIGIKQRTATRRKRQKEIEIKGRHDVCIVPRVIPVAQSMASIIVADHLLRQRAIQ